MEMEAPRNGAPMQGPPAVLSTALKREVFTVVNAIGYEDDPRRMVPDLALNLPEPASGLMFVVFEGGVQKSIVLLLTEQAKEALVKQLTGGIEIAHALPRIP